MKARRKDGENEGKEKRTDTKNTDGSRKKEMRGKTEGISCDKDTLRVILTMRKDG